MFIFIDKLVVKIDYITGMFLLIYYEFIGILDFYYCNVE